MFGVCMRRVWSAVASLASVSWGVWGAGSVRKRRPEFECERVSLKPFWFQCIRSLVSLKRRFRFSETAFPSFCYVFSFRGRVAEFSGIIFFLILGFVFF